MDTEKILKYNKALLSKGFSTNSYTDCLEFHTWKYHTRKQGTTFEV